MREKISLGFIAMVLTAILILVLYIHIEHNEKEQIQEHVAKIHGTVHTIEANGPFGDDPWPWYKHGKGTYIWRYTWEDTKGYMHLGIVCFGTFDQTDWIDDWKK